MRILGIDPGFERLGVAVLESSFAKPTRAGRASRGNEQVIFSECFKTSAQLEFPERLRLLGARVQTVIKKYKPEVLAMETLFMTTNQKTAMRVAEVRGVLLYEAARAGLKIFEATPPQIKIATTGYGRADKEQVMKMVRLLTANPVRGRGSLRALAASNGTDDELDAIAIALTGLAHLKN